MLSVFNSCNKYLKLFFSGNDTLPTTTNGGVSQMNSLKVMSE